MKIRLIADDEAPIRVPVGESILLVRRLSAAKEREIETTVRRKLLSDGTRDPQRIEAYNRAVEEAKLDYALAGWEKIEDDPLCTLENKLRLTPGAIEMVWAVAWSPGRREDSEKNSAGPSGTREASGRPEEPPTAS
jgi:hypothetical protein